ncbi:MAG: sigma 54-interacting transcriptional regulator [candidate division Zixibacteria bacterium]|nr:sigma 54-interacting transcriptional regulator [candidate division Zixibacteria bacterium]
MGQYVEAKESLIESYSAFLREDNFNWVARTLNRLSFICLLTGDINQAVINLIKTIEYYKKAGNKRKSIFCKGNLALIYRKCGRIKESLDIYENLFKKSDLLDKRNRCSLNLGYSLTVAISGDINKAKVVLQETLPLLHDFNHEQSLYYEFLGCVLSLENRFTEAEETFNKGLKLTLEIATDSDLVSQTKRLLGDLYLATQKYDLADKYATEGLEVAQKINERAEIAACYRIFARLEHKSGNADKAREWFRKAIDLFSQISSRYELAVTRYLASLTGLYNTGERIAMLYMAKQYFESEDIKHYIDKVDRALRGALLGKYPPSPPATAANGCPVIITANRHMKKLVSFAEHIAASDMTVLLTGPTGSGKDLLARYIHHHSGRRGEFVMVNAATVPDSMVEVEMFGYARGAFTGAESDKPGLFEMVEGGTFYLNELVDATGEFQAKLLEVLETRTFRRLGETTVRKVNFRVIAATNHDLQTDVRENRFRLDLYHRLNEIPITLPPLSERMEDIPLLVRYFLEEAGGEKINGQKYLDRLAVILSNRSWEGNIRQLRAEVKHLQLAAKGDMAQMARLALDGEYRTEMEKVLDILKLTGWNRTRTAEILGVSEGTVRNWIKKYSLCEVER